MEDKEVLIGKIINVESGKLENYPSSPVVTFTIENSQKSYIIQCICNSESLLKTTEDTIRDLENQKVVIFVKKHPNNFYYNLVGRIRKSAK